jgi:hypothetical protein
MDKDSRKEQSITAETLQPPGAKNGNSKGNTKKKNVKKVNRGFWKDFIELYRDQPCLWSAKSKCYSNKDLKQRSYEKLVEFVQKGIPEADMSL